MTIYIAPRSPDIRLQINAHVIRSVLGADTARLIGEIARAAERLNIPLYIVGGIVRDLLLDYPANEIDFVLEGNAIRFAGHLQKIYSGEITAYPQFGTATWKPSAETAQKLQVDFSGLPDHLDFAMARREIYTHPAALPTVSPSSIYDDLYRRDFTINTLAAQLSPSGGKWRILDLFDGMRDLQNRKIRILHERSFIDDPTRILRGVRFAMRFNFSFEQRTESLIPTGFAALQQTSGERIRHEFNLIFREDKSEQILMRLQELNVLPSIHPQFNPSARIYKSFKKIRTKELPLALSQKDRVELYWHITLATIAFAALPDLCRRLSLGQRLTNSIITTAQLIDGEPDLSSPDLSPSEVVRRLQRANNLALLAVWIMIENQKAYGRIEQYLLKWQYVQPLTDGTTLRQLGLKPGPIYKTILNTLRDAWLDGNIHAVADEKMLLQELINSQDQIDQLHK